MLPSRIHGETDKKHAVSITDGVTRSRLISRTSPEFIEEEIAARRVWFEDG